MNILDKVRGVASALMGAPDANLSSMLRGVSDLLDYHGGVQGLTQKFQQGGLGEIVSSWIGTGKNLAVSPQQLQKVFGSEALQNLAQKTGLDVNTVKAQLAQHLPNIIDKLTPNGVIPAGGIKMDQVLAVAKSLFSSKGM